LEALELEPQSSMSFLNLGSGTGYLSCMVAVLLGPQSVHVAVEVCPETIVHMMKSIARWKASSSTTDGEIPPIELIHGNALQIDSRQGEAASGFDRIYVGSSVGRTKLDQIAQLLRPGGILVGPGTCDRFLGDRVMSGDGLLRNKHSLSHQCIVSQWRTTLSK
jgi:precorrin-6B methylase 2